MFNIFFDFYLIKLEFNEVFEIIYKFVYVFGNCFNLMSGVVENGILYYVHFNFEGENYRFDLEFIFLVFSKKPLQKI